tara:strand:- start:849 stop:1640 length:792 start_codon:yes stop_codon:yes gene_type:complete
MQQYFRVLISYKGSNYYGWQDLGDGGKKPTIQFEILRCLRKICNYADCVVSGASRTDAGVHALGQIAKLTLPIEIVPDKLQLGLNSLLPDDIRISKCESCPSDFNPAEKSIGKMYRYYFSINEISSPTLSDIVAQLLLTKNSGSDTKLAIETMRHACELFVGEYDFRNFSINDKNVKSTVRKIFNLELLQSSLSDFGSDIYYFEIQGNGFLRHMIRYIVGALFELAKGTISIEGIKKTLQARQIQKLSAKVKSKGLHLIKINY